MLTRRRFLGYSAAGMLAGTAGCRPANFNWFLNQEEPSSNINLSLADKAKVASLKNFFLGYPINMNTPPDEFFCLAAAIAQSGYW